MTIDSIESQMDAETAWEIHSGAVRRFLASRLDDKEVATRLGLSLSATKSRIARTKIMIKNKFDTCCIFDMSQRHASIECDTFGSQNCDDVCSQDDDPDACSQENPPSPEQQN